MRHKEQRRETRDTIERQGTAQRKQWTPCIDYEHHKNIINSIETQRTAHRDKEHH